MMKQIMMVAVAEKMAATGEIAAKTTTTVVSTVGDHRDASGCDGRVDNCD